MTVNNKIIKSSLVKEFFHELGVSVSQDVYDKLDTDFRSKLETIALRTKGNRRITVKNWDC